MRTTAVYGSGKFGLAVREADLRPAGIHRTVPGRNADGVPDRAPSRSISSIMPRACVAPATAVTLAPRAAAQSRRRQCHRSRHGAVPGESSGVARSLDHGARDGAGAGARPVETVMTWERLPGACRARAQTGRRLDASDPLQQARIAALAADLDRLAAQDRVRAGRRAAVRRALSLGGSRTRHSRGRKCWSRC